MDLIKKIIDLIFSPSSTATANSSVVINNTNSMGTSRSSEKEGYENTPTKPLDEKKKLISILFIDDDTKFPIIKILERQGYANIRILKDIDSLSRDFVLASHIIFVDINNVGMKMGFADQGLGLALALKKEYPNKKVVIYSAETNGDRFHEALRSVDDFLSKNVEPYVFISAVDKLAYEVDL